MDYVRRKRSGLGTMSGALLSLVLVVSSSTLAAQELKAFGINCLANPFPATVTGTVVHEAAISSAITNDHRLTLWRKDCGASDPFVLATIEPTSSLGVNPTNVYVAVAIQNGVEYQALTFDRIVSSVLGPQPQLGAGPVFNLPKTLGLEFFASGRQFNYRGAFELRYRYLPRGALQETVVSVQFPAFSGQGSEGPVISGALSGTWYDPSRSGEGLMLEFGRAGGQRVASMSWYTWSDANDGRQAWLVGSAPYSAGARSVTIELLKASGGRFGSAFNPNQVNLSTWGTGTLTFAGCNALEFRWRRADGTEGTQLLERVVSGLDGVDCSDSR